MDIYSDYFSYNGYYIIYTCIWAMLYFLLIFKRYIKCDCEIPLIYLFVIIFSVFEGFRPFQVPDTTPYYSLYRVINCFKLIRNGIDSNKEIEYGFALLMKVFRERNAPYRVFLVFCSLIINISMITGLLLVNRAILKKKKSGVVETTALYFSLNCFHYSSIALRAGFSIGFGILAIGLFLNLNGVKKYIITGLLIICSVFCHIGGSIFLFILLVLIIKFRMSAIMYLMMWMFLLICPVFDIGSIVISIIKNIIISLLHSIKIYNFDGYLMRSTGNDDYGINVLLKVFTIGFVVLICYLYANNENTKNKKRIDNTIILDNYDTINISMFYSITFVVTLGVCGQGIAYRLQGIYRVLDYFYIFVIPVAVHVLCYSRNQIMRICLKISIPMLYALQMNLCYK